MALSKVIKLDNGVSLNYHVVDTIETLPDFSVKVLVHGFTSKNYYLKAIERNTLLRKQQRLVEEFTPLMEKEEPTKSEQKKLDKLQSQINDIALQIEETDNYEDCVLGEIIVTLSNVASYDLSVIEKLLLETEQFKLAKLVS